MRRVGELFAGRFAIEREAGSGGMGTVYAARDLHTDRPVALKLLQLGGSFAGDVERFSREAAVLAELDHPGIVSHVAHGTAPDGQRYLAMEWLDGEDLGQRLRRGPLPITDTLTLLRQVAAALALAHRRGVVHRGLCHAHKPSRNRDLRRAEKWRGKQRNSLCSHTGDPRRYTGLPGYPAVLMSGVPGSCTPSSRKLPRPGLGRWVVAFASLACGMVRR